MKKLNKILLVITFIMGFIVTPLILPIHNISNESLNSIPDLHARDGEIRPNVVLENNDTGYFNDLFTGWLHINNSTVWFNHCQFNNGDTIEIFGASTVTFFNSCSFDLSAAVQVYGEATVTIQNASLTSTAGFVISEAANVSMTNSVLEITVLAISDTAWCNVSTQCLFDFAEGLTLQGKSQSYFTDATLQFAPGKGLRLADQVEVEFRSTTINTSRFDSVVGGVMNNLTVALLSNSLLEVRDDLAGNTHPLVFEGAAELTIDDSNVTSVGGFWDFYNNTRVHLNGFRNPSIGLRNTLIFSCG